MRNIHVKFSRLEDAQVAYESMLQFMNKPMGLLVENNESDHINYTYLADISRFDLDTANSMIKVQGTLKGYPGMDKMSITLRNKPEVDTSNTVYIRRIKNLAGGVNIFGLFPGIANNIKILSVEKIKE